MLIRLLILLCLLSTQCRAQDGVTEAVEVAGVLTITARPPQPGEWVEYRLAFPVDPLENSLRTDPAPQPHVGLSHENAVEIAGEIYAKPSFEPAQAWRTLPLRIEVLSVTPLGCEALLRFEREERTVFLSTAEDRLKAEFIYDGQQPDDKTRSVFVGENEYQATVSTRQGDGYGFVRWSGGDVPFGIFRFATDHLDLVLVGTGTGEAPPFPLDPIAAITPPPGLLYHRNSGTESAYDGAF